MLYQNTSELDRNGKKGDWAFMGSTDVDGNDVKDAYICLMWGDDSFTQMAILPIVDLKRNQKPWIWNGDKEKPTLTPSILVRTTKPNSNGEMIELFHGYLTDGVIIHC